MPQPGDGAPVGRTAPFVGLTKLASTHHAGGTVNIAMVLELAADALGDRVAFGDLDDGMTYEQLRAAARAVAVRIEADGHR